MADVEFRLGNAIALNQMLPGVAGVAVGLPAALTATPGLYVILNQNNAQENRYMGISTNLRDRFSGRQGACFELGFGQAVLNNIYAFLGTVRYRNNVLFGWTNPAGYQWGQLMITLDGQNYDFEHLFIKAVQRAWPYGTITNTQKTGMFPNLGVQPINVTISWANGAQNVQVVIPVGGNLA